MAGIMNRKFIYGSRVLILHCNITGFLSEAHMSATTITQAQGKGLRHHFDAVSRFCADLFAAHGGWIKPRKSAIMDAMAARYEQKSRRKLIALAYHAEAYSPSLSAELRNLASKG